MNPSLLEWFAAHEQLPESAQDAWMQLKSLPGYEWLSAVTADAKHRAWLRFIRAKAMMEEAERLGAESMAVNPDMPELDRCPVCMWWQFDHKCPNNSCPMRSHGTAAPHGPFIDPTEAKLCAMAELESFSAPPKTTGLSFSEALVAMKAGRRVWRKGIAEFLKISNGLFVDYNGPRELSTEYLLAEDYEVVP